MRAHQQRQHGRNINTTMPQLVGGPGFHARSVDTSFGVRRPGGVSKRQMMKQKEWTDSPIAPGFKHTSLAKVPYGHQSHKATQDSVEEGKMREIRNCPSGARRDYLIEDLYYWQQNGRPVYGDQGPKSNKNDYRETQGKARGIWEDTITDEAQKTRRFKVDDLVAKAKEGM